jgi:phosphoglucomutase
MVCRWPERRFLGFWRGRKCGGLFQRLDGTVWTTDKDRLILGLLAAEITRETDVISAALYAELTREFDALVYERIDAPATTEQK